MARSPTKTRKQIRQEFLETAARAAADPEYARRRLDEVCFRTHPVLQRLQYVVARDIRAWIHLSRRMR